MILLSKKIFFLLLLFFWGIFFAFLTQYHKYVSESKIIAFDIPGESFLIRLSDGHNILVDTGMYEEVTQKIVSHLPFWEKNLDAVILSHSDRDHAEGLLSVFDHFSVHNIFLSGNYHKNTLHKEILLKAERENIPITFLSAERDIRTKNTTFDILFPQKSLIGKHTSGNNSSLVFRFISSAHSILFTGDIEKSSEKEILKTPVQLVSNILKVAHHGSKSSSSPEFLEAVQPQKAIISAAKNNPFGHPHKETLQRLSSFSLPVFVPQQEGDVVIKF